MELARAAFVVMVFFTLPVLAASAAERETDVVAAGDATEIAGEAAGGFHALAEQLELADRREAGTYEILERMTQLREHLRDVRRLWRETEYETRVAAREARIADFEAANEHLSAAISAYANNPRNDKRIVSLLRDSPLVADFLREPPVRTYQGIYRSGFDSSDFYLFDGEGPWWLEASGEAFEELQSYLVARPGRGSSVTVSVTVTGWIETEGGYGPLERHDTRIHAESIERIRPITEAEYWSAVSLTREMARH